MKAYNNFYERPDRSVKGRLKAFFLLTYLETWPDRLFFGSLYVTMVAITVSGIIEYLS